VLRPALLLASQDVTGCATVQLASVMPAWRPNAGRIVAAGVMLRQQRATGHDGANAVGTLRCARSPASSRGVVYGRDGAALGGAARDGRRLAAARTAGGTAWLLRPPRCCCATPAGAPWATRHVARGGALSRPVDQRLRGAARRSASVSRAGRWSAAVM
jgi:hypothetical protein